jgi:transcriptional regulator with XRE-family HTH domain
MSEFGAQLKQARERRGISLRQIATSTKISMAALEALERDDFSRLPGGIFSRAFVRAYATEVGIDPEETVQQFLAKFSELQAQRADDVTPIEVSADDRAFLERQRQAARMLRVGVIVIAVILIALVSYWRLTAHTGKPSARVGPAASTPAPERAAPITAARTPVPAPPSAPAALEVFVEATDQCWTEVTVDGKVAMKGRLLAVGERQTFSGDREVIVTAGNAGALTWTINGKAAKPIGRPGEVQTVRVNRDNVATFLR